MPEPRKISPDVAWRAVGTALGRLACESMDPADGHDHNECLHDDVAYAADLQLRLLAAVLGDDDDQILARLEELRAAVATTD